MTKIKEVWTALRNRGKRIFISLNLKMTAVILIGILLSVGMYFLCNWVKIYVADVRYLTEKAVTKSVNSAYDSLEKYIDENDVKGTDKDALSKWLQSEEYTYLNVYDNQNNVFEAGWWVDSSTGTSGDNMEDQNSNSNSELMPNNDTRIDEDIFPVDAQNRIIRFADGKYYVFIDVYKEQHWYSIMDLMTVILCFLTLLATILLYNRHMLKRLIHLSEEVQQVSDGNLNNVIQVLHNDELGSLAASVDNMRNSVIEKLQNEKKAWDANTQLITAMSHDIRTPLTSLIGYLDIISTKKYSTQEELEKYIDSCRDKSFQLKELSDKLFQYFLVFGNHDEEKKLESYDAGILIQQILAEHCAELMTQDYRVDFRFEVPENIFILTDISGIRRLFDNIFSNIMKYADPQVPIQVKAVIDDENINIVIVNGIAEIAKKVESTRIGVKTCERICYDMHGTFEERESEKEFEVEITFPVAGHGDSPDSVEEDDGTEQEKE